MAQFGFGKKKATRHIDREPGKCTKWLKEVIGFEKKNENRLSLRRGTYKLHNVYDQLILITPKAAIHPTYKLK